MRTLSITLAAFIAVLAPLVGLMIWIGWHPTPLLERMEPSVRAVIERVELANPELSQESDDEVVVVTGE